MEEFGWEHLDELYRRNRGKGKATPKTLVEQIDFGGKLSSQPRYEESSTNMVLHPLAGDVMRAARTSPGSGFVDASLYWHRARIADEAGYLTALLNAPILRRAFFEARESGRNFHLSPWRKVPIRCTTLGTNCTSNWHAFARMRRVLRWR